MSNDHHTQIWERDDKAAHVITLTLNKTPTAEQWESFQLDVVPSLNKPDDTRKFEQLEYVDGNFWSDGLDHYWSYNMSHNKIGLIGCDFRGNQIKIWSDRSELAPALFLSIAHEILSEISEHELFKNADITNVATSGISVRYTGASLKEVAASLDTAAAPAAPQNKPKAPGRNTP